jgi:hypothetical protein
MTRGRRPAPLATDADSVAGDTVRALRSRRRTVVWSPPVLRAAYVVLRLLPAPVWRRVSDRHD